MGTSNFLIPNGTFFVCLLIFVIIVFPVIKFYGGTADRQGSRRTRCPGREDNKAAAASYEAATTEYEAALKDARGVANRYQDPRHGRR